MGKKYNYFDDEPLEPPKRTRVPKEFMPKSSSKKKIDIDLDAKDILSIIKKIIAFVGMYALLAIKAIRKGLIKVKNNHGGVAVGLISLAVTVVVLTTIIIISVMGTTSKRNSRQKEFYQAAAKVCSQYTEKYGVANYKYMNSEYEVGGCMLTGLCVAREIDFNADGHSELLLAYNDNDEYFAEIWGFHSGEFQKLHDVNIYQTGNRNDDIWVALYSSGNEFFLAEHNKDDITDVTILKISGGSFKRKTVASYNTDDLCYYLRKKNVNNDFEQIKFAVLRENVAATTVEKTLDAIDDFINSLSEEDSVEINVAEITSNINTAYCSLIDEYTKDYGQGEFVGNSDDHYLDGLAIVRLVDFNKDSVDELMLIYRRTVQTRKEDYKGNSYQEESEKYFCDIYAWNGNNAVLVHQNQGLSNTQDDNDIIYYVLGDLDDRIIFCTNTFNSTERGHVVKGTSKQMSFDGSRFNIETKAVYENNWGYSTYTLDGKNMNKTKFTDNGGFDVPYFDGSTTYDSSVWTIGYVQGENRDETKMKKQLELTESTIEKLRTK